MSTQAIGGARLSDLKWRNASGGEVAAAMGSRRYRGEERSSARSFSGRGFGPRRKRNEVAPNLSTLRDGWYYDTVTFAAGAAVAKTLMFQVAQSGSKFLNSTNLSGNGGQVPTGDVLNLRSIRIYIANTTVPADFQNIINNCSVQFLIKNTPIYQSTPEWFPAGNGGVTLSVGNLGTLPSGTASVVSTTNGMPVQTAVYEFKRPYLMESQLPFVLQLNPEVAFNMTASSGVNPLGVGTTIRVWLEGERQGIVIS
jgi:hypothetical protein